MATYSEWPSKETAGRRKEPRGGLRAARVRMQCVGQGLWSRGRSCRTLVALLVTAALLSGVLLINETQLDTASRPVQRLTSHQGDFAASPRPLNRTSPAWMSPEKCTPRTNIGFLKTHKCASSAIQNILFRYGLKHNLHFALPEKANYFGSGIYIFSAEMVFSSPFNKLQPNIFTMHTRWNHDEVRKVMPEDTVYFTIVREPTELFQSLFVYYAFHQQTGLTMEQYVRDDAMDPPLRRYSQGYNQMAWDFGVSPWKMKSLPAVSEMVERAEKQFGLVLVAERMDESLVLLAEYLCWELEDMVVLNLNAVRKQYKPQLSSGALQLLKKRLAPDYLIYEHFTERFEREVEAYGKQRMAEAVERLQKIKAKVVAECGFVRREAFSLMMNDEQRPYSNLVDGYANSGGEGCSLYSLPELAFIDKLREKQREEVEERFGWPPR